MFKNFWENELQEAYLSQSSVRYMHAAFIFLRFVVVLPHSANGTLTVARVDLQTAADVESLCSKSLNSFSWGWKGYIPVDASPRLYFHQRSSL